MKRVLGILLAGLLLLAPGSRPVRAEDLRPNERIAEGGTVTVGAAADEAALRYREIPLTACTVSGLAPGVETALDYTDLWYSAWDDCRYLFLPATADRTALTITYDAADTLYLDGQAVVSGETTGLLAKADVFALTIGETDCGALRIMQSDRGCVYLTTAHGGTDALDADRFLVETGAALMLDADGGIVYDGALEKLTAHGNSSWDYSLKKSYNIKLPKKADLYGMGKAKKWALVSNFLDHSMLRNKLTEEMCRAAGMAFVMDSVFVDLYADGSYRGTYQLSERVQIQEQRVNIRDLEEKTEDVNEKDLDGYPQRVIGADSPLEYIEDSYKYYDIPHDPADITGGYLLQFQQWNRYPGKTASGFVTARGQAIELDQPEYASKAQVEYIRAFVQEAEDAIYSPTGYNAKGAHYSDLLDMDSLLLAYLVQEISMNIDGTFTSFYLWKDSDVTGDGKLHFGPAWDFDLAYGDFPASRSNSNGMVGHSVDTARLFIAYFPISGYLESDRPTCGVSWIGQLFGQAGFEEQAAAAYYAHFAPFLSTLTQGETPYLTQMAEDLRASAEMNNARWHTYGGKQYTVFGGLSGATYLESAELVRQFIARRKEGLEALWAPKVMTPGDVDANGVFDIVDVIALQKWLHAVPDAHLVIWQAGDLDADGRLDTLDLSRMKRALTAGE